jgi:hypothetical protein
VPVDVPLGVYSIEMTIDWEYDRLIKGRKKNLQKQVFLLQGGSSILKL